jgi:hypothetical protein
MARRRKDDDDFDQRLEDDIITDAKPDELWIGWYYYRQHGKHSVDLPGLAIEGGSLGRGAWDCAAAALWRRFDH